MSLSRRLFPILLFLLFLCASAFADRLKVTVVDPQSAVAAGARVALYAASDHAVAVVTTSAEGIASFDRLTPGEYQVEVLAPGFAPNRKTVSVSGDSTVKLALTITVANERVEVTAARTPTSAAETASTVETLDRFLHAYKQGRFAKDPRWLPQHEKNVEVIATSITDGQTLAIEHTRVFAFDGHMQQEAILRPIAQKLESIRMPELSGKWVQIFFQPNFVRRLLHRHSVLVQ